MGQSIGQSVKSLLNGMLSQGVTDKVKIIHESFPELFLENYADEAEEYFSFGDVVKTAGKLALNAGKGLLTNIIQKLVEKISGWLTRKYLTILKPERMNSNKHRQNPRTVLPSRSVGEIFPGWRQSVQSSMPSKETYRLEI